MVYEKQTKAFATWLISITYGVEFAFQMQWTSFKLNVPQIIHSYHEQHNHVLVHSISMLSSPPLLMIAPITVPPRR